jgi:AcrR family transcriptional regulator
LLASLAVCASLLEIVVRELVLDYMRNKASRHRDLQAELEAQRHISFATLVEALREVGRVSADDAKAAKSFHDTVRVPILHGLPRRFVQDHDGVTMADLRKRLGLPGLVSIHELEDVLERHAIGHIKTVADILWRTLASNAAQPSR